jgi:23S rRNA pseudouridine2605 synthase
MLERLQKIIARAGISSRRGAEELIRQGRVHVNGRPAAIGAKADPERDRITVDGVPVRSGRLVYYALYKPRGVVTTMGDEHGRRTVAGLAGVRRLEERVFPVGRLDCDAEGLLILTNDGDLANRIAHPRHGVTKTYRVLLDRAFEDVERLERGVVIEGKRVDVRNFRCRGREVVLTIHEGRNHIVKRLFRKLGYTVRSLKRTRIGRIDLGRLAPGGLRSLEREEIERSLGPVGKRRGKGGRRLDGLKPP